MSVSGVHITPLSMALATLPLQVPTGFLRALAEKQLAVSSAAAHACIALGCQSCTGVRHYQATVWRSPLIGSLGLTAACVPCPS